MTTYISGAGGALAGNYQVDLFAADVSGQGTWAFTNDAEPPNGGDLRNTTTADGDNFTMTYIPLQAGTYTLKIAYMKNTNGGKADVYIDSTKVVSGLDFYAGSLSQRNISTTANITIGQGLHSVKFQVNGKNGSSSSYQIFVNSFRLVRTA